MMTDYGNVPIGAIVELEEEELDHWDGNMPVYTKVPRHYMISKVTPVGKISAWVNFTSMDGCTVAKLKRMTTKVEVLN